MRLLDGGVFRMGSDRFYPEEKPARHVSVDAFRIDVHPVTNRQFAQFVAATGYHTWAERVPDAADYPGADPALLVPASAVFTPTAHPVDTRNPALWWRLVPGADWRHPSGPHSDLTGLEDHPVVHVALADAEAYAAWAGKRLPTEAEWEFAVRGGLAEREYAWGDELAPDGRRLANYWAGVFPCERGSDDGFARTSPVGFYPANGFGLFDMIGNVWEWTADWYSEAGSSIVAARPCCAPRNPRGGDEAGSRDPRDATHRFGRKVLKGGSHLCAQNYCQRYRPAARHPQAVDSSTSHIGFRCAAAA
jgi:formylglycine-generating enzyme required for sulfatase activity